MTQSVTEYAVLTGETVEHIWQRKLGGGLWHSLCGMLSDGESFYRTDDGTACSLCERIQRVKDQLAQEQVRHA